MYINLRLLFKKEMPEIFEEVPYNEKFEEMYFQKLAELIFMDN